MTGSLEDARAGPDRSLRFVLWAGVALQALVAWRQVGWLHPDQHFSIVEFASHSLGRTPAESLAWEWPHRVRQALPVYGFLGLHHALDALGLDDVYDQMAVLRLLLSLAGLALLDAILLHAFRGDRPFTRRAVLLLGNLAWCLPYARTLYAYETLGGLAFFGALWVHLRWRRRGGVMARALAVGFALGLAFYLRFQMGFALVGLAAWLLLVDRPGAKALAAMAVGFVAAAVANTALDSAFYGELVLTPLNYFRVNILEGRAAQFGSSSPLYYLGVLSLVLTVPPLSVALLLLVGRGIVARWKDPYVACTVLFLLGHFAVGHKEDRFLIPIFGILPLLAGYGLRAFLERRRIPVGGEWAALPRKSLIWPSLVGNAVALLFLCAIPVCQQVEFTRRLDRRFAPDGRVHLVCHRQSPYSTGAGSVATWYLDARPPGVEVTTLRDPDAFRAAVREAPPGTWFVGSLRRLAAAGLLDLVPERTEMVSSEALVPFARWLHARTGVALPEMWIAFRPAGSGTGGEGGRAPDGR